MNNVMSATHCSSSFSCRPAVRKITALGDLRAAEAKNPVFFIIIEGEKSSGELRREYQEVAEELLTSVYFYETETRLATGVCLLTQYLYETHR